MNKLKEEFRKELLDNILPFWMKIMPDPDGGFFGRMTGEGELCPDAEKGAILNARILWTFSASARVLADKNCLEWARYAFDYLREHFIDRQYGGVFWSLNADGTPRDTKKQFYAIAFTVYALAEYYRATEEIRALDEAIELFRCIEEHSLDKVDTGYLEACTRNWGTIDDMRLSDKDMNAAKTMNTHLHILEAYTGLYRVWKDAGLATALKRTIRLFLDRIVCSNGHLGLFFDNQWRLCSTAFSYGHDIETSWLLCEAADVLAAGNPGGACETAFQDEVRRVSAALAGASMEGFTPEGGMQYEFDPATGHRNPSRDWWVQAETVVGCVNRFQLTSNPEWMRRAIDQWEFIKKHIICPNGEWYWAALPDGSGGFSPDTVGDRAGFWKCPYHNGRMCLEIIERNF